MATVLDSLIWQIVRKNNSLIKQFGNGNAKVQFSKEPNNLYNVHSYKHSALPTRRLTMQPASGKEIAVVLSTTKTKKQNRPASLHHESVMRKEFRKMAKSVKNHRTTPSHVQSFMQFVSSDVVLVEDDLVGDNYYRPDLTKPALARLSAVYRSLRVAKSGVKKNRQAN